MAYDNFFVSLNTSCFFLHLNLSATKSLLEVWNSVEATHVIEWLLAAKSWNEIRKVQYRYIFSICFLAQRGIDLSVKKPWGESIRLSLFLVLVTCKDWVIPFVKSYNGRKDKYTTDVHESFFISVGQPDDKDLWGVSVEFFLRI